MPRFAHAFVQRIGIELYYSKGSLSFFGLFFIQYTSSRKRIFRARAGWSPHAVRRANASKARIEPRCCLSPTITVVFFAHVVSYYRAHVPSRIRNSIPRFCAGTSTATTPPSMPATREPVTKRAERQSPWLFTPHPSATLISHLEACIRADLSFRLLSAGLRYEPYPPLLPQQPLVNGRLPRESNASCISLMSEVLWRPPLST
jgi:hypothetical protein